MVFKVLNRKQCLGECFGREKCLLPWNLLSIKLNKLLINLIYTQVIAELCCGATTLNFKRSNSCWEKDMMDRRIWPLHQPREKIEIELLVLGDHINQSRNRGLANDKERLGQSVLCAASKVDTGTSWGDSEMCTPVCLHNTTKKKLGVS